MNKSIPGQEPPEIEGTWRPFKGELAGEAAPDLVLQRTEVVLQEGRYEVRFDRDVSDGGTYFLATAGSHRTLTLTGIRGTNAGRVIPAIYQRVGDRLRICYGLNGVLPIDFTTTSGSKRYLVIYRRVV